MFQTEILERIHQPSTKYVSKIFKNEKKTKFFEKVKKF